MKNKTFNDFKRACCLELKIQINKFSGDTGKKLNQIIQINQEYQLNQILFFE